MTHRALESFWSKYRRLAQEIQAKADQQFALFKTDPRHPSLQWKKLGTSRNNEVVRASDATVPRIGDSEPDHFLWFWIGDHDEYDQLISSLDGTKAAHSGGLRAFLL